MSLLEIGKGKLTVGKIYGGLLILENWKQTKFGGLPLPKVSSVSLSGTFYEPCTYIFSIYTIYFDFLANN